MARTLALFRDDIRQKTGMLNSTFITDTRLNQVINEAGQALHQDVVTLYEDYLVSSTTFSLVGGQGLNFTTIGSNMLKMRGLDYFYNNQYLSIRRMSFSERNDFNENRVYSALPTGLRYMLTGPNLYVLPDAVCTGQYQLWFINAYTPMVADTDTLVQALWPWEDYVSIEATIQLLTMEETDAQVWMGKRTEIRQRITAAGADRDAGSPLSISDTRAAGSDWLKFR